MKEICVFDKTLIYRPSFIDILKASLYKATKDAPKDKKFRIIIEPVENTEHDTEQSFSDIFNKYLDFKKPSDEEMKRLNEIPPDELKQMISDWWDRCVVQMRDLRKEVEQI